MNETARHEMDKQFMIECLSGDVIRMLMEDFGYDMAKAMNLLYTSDTYHKLENEGTGLYYQSSVYLYDMLKEELAL